MILLDTNVVSEVMRPSPNGLVLRWLNETPTADLFVSSITIAELWYGICALPAGQRREALATQFAQFIEQGFQQRTLVFDAPAAQVYGEMMGEHRHNGAPMSVLDRQIAAIARTHYATLATRNTHDFAECGVPLINPWDYGA